MTKNRKIEAGQWEKVTSADCSFQVIGQREMHVSESTTAPSDATPYKIALPQEIYHYTHNDGSLYAKAIDVDNVIAWDPE
jgi:hypothetical protein